MFEFVELLPLNSNVLIAFGYGVALSVTEILALFEAVSECGSVKRVLELNAVRFAPVSVLGK